MENRIFLSPPFIGEKELHYVKEAFDENWIAPLGKNVDEFERDMCKYTGSQYGLAVNSGTAAIHLTLRYLGVEKGDIVFSSSLTFAGTCNPILYQQGIPVFIDSEYESANMSAESLLRAFEAAKKKNTLPKAVIIVDIFGNPADYKALLPICRHYGVPVIEDAAEALGAEYDGERCGGFGEFGIVSFNGNKIITTSGGGMILSNNFQAIEKMRFLSTQAREPAIHYEHKEYGYNYRMSNICAGIGRGQLEILKDKVNKRTQIYYTYASLFQDLPIRMLPYLPNSKPNFWVSVMIIDKGVGVSPTDICLALENGNIEARPAWKPMHMQPVFKQCDFFSLNENGSVSEDLFSRGVCLPSGEAMTEREFQRISEIVKKCFR